MHVCMYVCVCAHMARLTTTLYGLLAIIAIVNSEIFPIWVLNDKEHGGFGFQVCISQ